MDEKLTLKGVVAQSQIILLQKFRQQLIILFAFLFLLACFTPIGITTVFISLMAFALTVFLAFTEKEKRKIASELQ